MKRKSLLINDKGEHYYVFVTLYRGIDRKEHETPPQSPQTPNGAIKPAVRI